MPRRTDRHPPPPGTVRPGVHRHVPPTQDPPRASDAVGFRTLDQLRAWHRLWVRCSHCYHAALIDSAWLRSRRPADEALARIASRCRCTRCSQLGTTWWRVVAADRNT